MKRIWVAVIVVSLCSCGRPSVVPDDKEEILDLARMSKESSISEFWSWFEAHAEDVRDACHRGDDGWLDNQISPRLREIQEGLAWEIGPYLLPDDTLVLSPTIRENLPLTRLAVSQAPAIPGWRFLPAKPPKVLKSLVFEMDDFTIRADDWRYRLTAYNSGEFADIELLIDAGSQFPTGIDPVVTELVVESLIGEACRLERVGDISTTFVSGAASEARSTPIRHLKDHLAKVLSPRTEEEDQDGD